MSSLKDVGLKDDSLKDVSLKEVVVPHFLLLGLFVVHPLLPTKELHALCHS